MAVDFGPRSQHGWLVNNASKFGLASGISHGEPWHVGMPGDMGDVGDLMSDMLSASGLDGGGLLSSSFGNGGFLDMLGPILSILTGQGTGTDMINLMGSAVPAMFSKLLGFFGGSGKPSASTALDFNPNIYQGLTDASIATLSKLTFGGVEAKRPPMLDMSGPNGGKSESPLDTVLGWFGVGSPNLSGSVGSGVQGGGAASFSGPVGSLQRAKAAAQVAYNAGFRGQDLFEIVSIGGRESGGWRPDAINPTTSDRGLFQINWAAHGKELAAAHIAYQDTDLLDPTKNAQAAHLAFLNAGSQWWPWGLNSAGVWDRHGDPLARTQQYQPTAREAISELNLGDTDAYYGDVSSGPNRVTVHHWAPTINLSMNGGGQGIDLRRTASILATHLQGEMDKRLVRSS
jgi:hypothetical protein